ncbi:MAG: TolB family protein [Puniceicoccaceae bacterium]
MKGLNLAALLALGCSTPVGGTTVEPFLQDSLEDHIAVRDLSIRSDGRELYFSSQSFFGEISSILYMVRDEDGGWSDPQMAAFSGDYNDLEPFLSPDGLRLYFASNRPREDGQAGDYDIWYVERDDFDGAWSPPVNMGQPVNSEANEFYPAITAGEEFFFTSDREGSLGKDDIFHYSADGDEPLPLGKAVNSDGYEFNAFVAPDGSFLIYTAYNREGGYGSGDLYISHRQEDGSWGESLNLGPEINSPRMDYCPFVDANGTLYFTSKRIAFSEAPYGFRETEAFLDAAGQYANGQSRLYRMKEFESTTQQEQKGNNQ